MHSALSKHANELKSLLTESESFETTIVLKSTTGYHVAEITCYQIEPNVNVHIKTAGGSHSVRHRMAGIEEAFAKVTEEMSGSVGYLDTVSIKVRQRGEERYLNSTDPSFQLARSAWNQAFGEKVQTARTNNKNAELIRRFEQEVMNVDKFQTSIWVKADGSFKEAELFSSKQASFVHVYVRRQLGIYEGLHYRAGDMTAALATMAQFIHGAELTIDTLMVKTNREKLGPVADEVVSTSDSFYDLTRSVWCAVVGLEQGCGISFQKNFDPQKMRDQHLKQLLLSYLSSGEGGVQLWNKRPQSEKQLVCFKETNLERRQLNRLAMVGLDFKKSKFDGASMQSASLGGVDLSKSSFVGVDLSDSELIGAVASGANFSDANLTNTVFNTAKLQNSTFKNTNVTGASFRDADLRGVDLTGCNANDAASFQKAKYDERTRIPEGFVHWWQLQWKGKASDPYKLTLKDTIHSSAPVNFAGFIEHLQDNFDKSRISKSLAMLKKEKFQLFSEQSEQEIVGVIKSQTDPDLVYACRLGKDGSFSCCTQNLNPCGGLRGALCKHILVLIIGLTKAGALDTTYASRAVLSSKIEQPKLDREKITEVFLRYKGAQAGEMDWRPTETMPEDYYAF